MAKKDIIEILFGVKGGGSISGESGKKIKQQLQSIAKAVKPTVIVKINEGEFKKQLKKLSGEIKIEPTKKGGSGNKSGSSGKSGGKEKDPRKQTLDNTSKAYKELNKDLEKWLKLLRTVNENNEKNKKKEESAINEKLVESLRDEYEVKLKIARESGFISKDEEERLESQRELLEEITKARKKDIKTSKIENAPKQAAKAENLLTRNKDLIKSNEEAKKVAEDLEKAIENAMNPDLDDDKRAEAVEELQKQLALADGEFAKLTRKTDTFGNKIKKAFTHKVVEKFAYMLYALIANALHQVYQNVLALDKALVDLQIATGGTREETAALIKDYAKLAQELGVVVTEVTSAADTWLRQGYDMAETNKLITSSMYLSVLGQMDSAAASKALTSAMKGYNLTAEQSIDIADKLTAVDIKAAVTAGDIATAMAETNVSAASAGISMDKLIGYITTVSEVTQDGAESVGTFYKTMFARMGNVKAGRFVDDETGEKLNDVASVLDHLGISLFEANGDFKNFGTVLDEVGEKWGTYNNVQQAAIATAIAGTRQQEKFRVLMENYGSALDYANTAANSAGTAQNKYNESYLQGIEANINRLKAQWQELSTALLDSDLVIFFVKLLSGIVNMLNKLASLGDGFVVTSTIVVAAVVLMQSAIFTLSKNAPKHFAKIKQSAHDMGVGIGKAFASPYTYISLFISLYISFRGKMNQTTKLIVACFALLGTGIAIAMAKAQKAVENFNKSNWVGWILAAVSAAVMAIDALVQRFKAKENAAQAALKETKEAAEEATEAFHKEQEELAEITSLVEEYKKLVGDNDDFLSLGEDTRNRLIEIQNKINGLVIDEGTYIDVVNGKLKEQAGILDENIKKQAQATIEAAKAAINAQSNVIADSFDKDGNFIVKEGGHIDDIYSPFGSGKDIKTGYNIVFERGKDAAKHAADIFSWFTGSKYIKGAQIGNISSFKETQVSDVGFADNVDEMLRLLALGVIDDDDFDDKSYNIGFEAKPKDMSNQEYFYLLASEFKNALDNTAHYASSGDTATYQLWSSLNKYYETNFKAPYEAMQKSMSEALDPALLLSQLEAEESYDPDKKWDEFKADFKARVLNITKEFGWGEEVINSKIESYLKTNYAKKYNTGEVKYAFEYILEEVQGGYDLIKEALNDMDELDIISANTLNSLFEDHPDMKKYFEETADGYKLVEGAMESFIKDMKDLYGLGANESTFLAVISTLKMSDNIDKFIKSQEASKEYWEKDLDKTKELIDIRKDLLKTYKEELDYKEELAKKQKAVASLETQLTLSRLDRSAAGQARTRELEKELEEAQGELDDFTLEHAIDVITEQLDNSYNEYKKFIDEKVAQIETAIAQAAKTRPEQTGAGNGEIINEGSGSYHTGGFVGGIQSNEEYAKLMKGEFVSTPAQMSRFMTEILPRIALAGQVGGISYNAPLVAIQCESVTPEAIPDLERLVNQAVSKIKTEIDNAFSRTGFKKKI